MIRAEVVTEIARLRELEPAWSELLSRSESDEPTLHPMWMLAWWEVYGPRYDRALRCVAFFSREPDERLVGFAPLLRRPHMYRPRLPFRRLELLASGETEADETCSDYLGLVAEKGLEKEVVNAFASVLDDDEIGGWDEITLSAMNGQSVLPGLLKEAFEGRGFTASLEEHNACPYVTLPATWDAYLAGLKRKKRWQLKDALKTYEAWSGGPPTIVRVERASDLARGRQILVELHRERWSEDGSSGVFGSSCFCEFHDQIMPAMLARGALDLGWLEARGEPVAAFYNFRWNGKVFHYQSGRKLGVPEDVRVGFVMNTWLIRHAIEQGMREYDFLAGESAYKSALASGRRPLVALRAARPSVKESVRVTTDRAIERVRGVRDRVRRHLPAPLKELARAISERPPKR